MSQLAALSLWAIPEDGTQADPELSKGTGNLGRIPRKRASEEKLHREGCLGATEGPLRHQPGTHERASVKKLTEAGWDEIMPNTPARLDDLMTHRVLGRVHTRALPLVQGTISHTLRTSLILSNGFEKT